MNTRRPRILVVDDDPTSWNSSRTGSSSCGSTSPAQKMGKRLGDSPPGRAAAHAARPPASPSERHGRSACRPPRGHRDHRDRHHRPGHPAAGRGGDARRRVRLHPETPGSGPPGGRDQQSAGTGDLARRELASPQRIGRRGATDRRPESGRPRAASKRQTGRRQQRHRPPPRRKRHRKGDSRPRHSRLESAAGRPS